MPQRLGNAHPNIVPYQSFATADGHIILAVGNDGQFRRFCETAGCAALADDPRFASNALRVQHRNELIPLLLEPMRGKTTDEWLISLEQVGVPCGPINTLDRVFDDPQVKHRGLKITRSHPEDGEVSLVSNPIRFNGEALNAPTAPPMLGEHTEAILSRHLGLDAQALADLKAKGVI